MITVTFPTNVALDLLVQEYQINTANFIGIGKIAPVLIRDTYMVEWEQMDVETGMTPPHQIGTDPIIETQPGAVRRSYEPGAFKASEMIDEGQILRGRTLGTFGNILDLSDRVARRMAARQAKTFVSMEYCVWKALGGRLQFDTNGVHIDETFPVQTFRTVVPWADHANATPLADLRALAQLFPGTGASADGAIIYLRQVDIDNVLKNRNEADLWGERGAGLVTPTLSLKRVNEILAENKLPMLEVYEEGFVAPVTKDFTRFVTAGHPICIGKRPAGQVVANFMSTISLHRTKNGVPAGGAFSILEVNNGPNNGSMTTTIDALGQVANPSLKMTGGIYGGPVIWFPRSVVALDVTHTGA